MKENKEINELLEELNFIADLEALGFNNETIEAIDEAVTYPENLFDKEIFLMKENKQINKLFVELDRNFISIELDTNYFNIAKKRIEEYDNEQRTNIFSIC